MKDGHLTSAPIASPAATAVDPASLGRAVVLRNAPVHHEARVLPRPGGGSRGRGTVDSLHQVDVLDVEGNGDARSSFGPEPSGYRAQAEVAASYQRGYEAGRADAEMALRAAQEDALERGFRAGFERGVQEGREQGIADGREAGRREVEIEARAFREAASARIAKLDELLASLPRELQRLLAGAEEEMVALAHAVVCRILGDQLVTREGVAHQVAQAVRDAGSGFTLGAPGRRTLAVHVHPADLELLRADARLAAWLGDAAPSGTQTVRWVPDERVTPSGCLVRSPDGTLDARLEVQMEGLRRVLLEWRGGSAAVAVGDPGRVVDGSGSKRGTASGD